MMFENPEAMDNVRKNYHFYHEIISDIMVSITKNFVSWNKSVQVSYCQYQDSVPLLVERGTEILTL
jgi:hypothetical protein